MKVLSFVHSLQNDCNDYPEMCGALQIRSFLSVALPVYYRRALGEILLARVARGFQRKYSGTVLDGLFCLDESGASLKMTKSLAKPSSTRIIAATLPHLRNRGRWTV